MKQIAPVGPGEFVFSFVSTGSHDVAPVLPAEGVETSPSGHYH